MHCSPFSSINIFTALQCNALLCNVQLLLSPSSPFLSQFLMSLPQLLSPKRVPNRKTSCDMGLSVLASYTIFVFVNQLKLLLLCCFVLLNPCQGACHDNQTINFFFAKDLQLYYTDLSFLLPICWYIECVLNFILSCEFGFCLLQLKHITHLLVRVYIGRE